MRAFVLTATVAAALAGCGGAGKPAAPAPRTVAIVDNAFHAGGHDRPTLRVQAGQAVRWVWRGQESHQLTVRSGPARFSSKTKTRGTFTETFARTGVYHLECSLHAPGMKMTVVVG